MMSEDNFSDESGKTRRSLADVTNLPAKRSFSSISGDEFVKNLGGGSRDEFAKKVCLQVENLVKEKCKTMNTSLSFKDNESNVSLPSKRENIVSVVSNAVENVKSRSRFSDLAVDVGGSLREGCVSSDMVPKKGCGGERRSVSDTALSYGAHDELATSASGDKDCGLGGTVVSSKCGSSDWLKLPKSQSSRSFGLEHCVGVKADHCANMNAADLLKDCSCSFCLKAAYIWSDLHYQDMKGRIAALKKSQKEASFLVEKCGKGKQTDVSELESGLMNQWRSHFLHMEDIFVNESNQLQSSFLSLKELRENCKMDLEKMSYMPSDES